MSRLSVFLNRYFRSPGSKRAGKPKQFLTGDAHPMPLRTFSGTRIRIGKKGEPVTIGDSKGETLSLNREISQLSIAVNDPIFCGHYFHFIEVVIALFTGIKEFYPNAQVLNCYMMNQSWLNESQNGVQRHLLLAAFPGVHIISKVEDSFEAREETLLIFNREWGGTGINKTLEPLVWLARRHFKELSTLIESYLNPASGQGTISPSIVIDDVEKKPVALYVHRNPPRTLESADEESLIGLLAERGYSIETVDYSGMSFFDQVIQSRRGRLIIGVHGNGLTNLLWLPRGSTVIELFPDDTHHYDYQVLSEICGHHYYGVECSSNPYIFRDFSRNGEAYGMVNSSQLLLPKKLIANLLTGIKDPV